MKILNKIKVWWNSIDDDYNFPEPELLYIRSDDDRRNFIKSLVKRSEHSPLYLTKELINDDMANVWKHRIFYLTWYENKARTDLGEYLKTFDRELSYDMSKNCFVITNIKNKKRISPNHLTLN